MAAPDRNIQEMRQAIARIAASVAVVAMLGFLKGPDEIKRRIFAALSSPQVAELPSVIQAGIAEFDDDLARITVQVRMLIKSNLMSAGLKQHLAQDVLSVCTKKVDEVITIIAAEM